MGRNFVLNGTQGEVGVSLKKSIFCGETHFHSVTTQMQDSGNLLLPHDPHHISPSIYGNTMCNGEFASKLTKKS